ncbi:monooxygenase family protein [Streptomyces sp. NPDC056405]|uniref:monooxygenase family protein n=1 Tax=Streptomyces sp. NPDC056405 TaxID=3345811 RepID=UPI0035D6DB50
MTEHLARRGHPRGETGTAVRTTAPAEGDVVVLMIGMRITHFWAVHHWLPALLAYGARAAGAWPRMLRELAKNPAGGLLGHVLLTASPRTRGHVGLWHEAYVVPEGSYESIYADMPAFGPAAAHGQVPLERRGKRAKDRFAHRSGERAAPEKA